jgi:hypothetical protein
VKAEFEQNVPEFLAANYCISFIDLLGQRDAFRGQGLLPTTNSGADGPVIDRVLRETIGPTLQLQQDVEDMVKTVSGDQDSSLRMSLPEEQRAVYDELRLKRVKTQYWSDGLIRFVCLGDQEIKCPLNGITEIFQFSGYFCMLALARRHPVRGAIDMAWGVELPRSGLYGPVVANAYELESHVAQYPRIVVGQRVVDFLEAHLANTGDDHDPFAMANHVRAGLCRDMLLKDVDGYWIVHYLGNAFQFSVTHTNHGFFYGKARAFVVEQLEAHRKSNNEKLMTRYSQLLNYFDAHLAAK